MKKTYGMPYLGSKTKIIHLIEYILQRHQDKKYFIDAFCGGFSVSHYVLANSNMVVLANDLNPYIIALYNEIFYNKSENFDKVRYEWVSREMFVDVRDNQNKYDEWYVGYVLTIWSFGNNQKTYLFGKDIETEKKALHYALVYDDYAELSRMCDFYYNGIYFGKPYTNAKRLDFMKEYKKYAKSNSKIKIQRLENIERLQQLERLQRLDYYEFIKGIPKEILEQSIIYFDPPYKDTQGYQFNAVEYDKMWVLVKSLKNIAPIYISGYAAPSDIIRVNYENKIKLNRINSFGARTKAIESLFYNGYVGETELTLLDMLNID